VVIGYRQKGQLSCLLSPLGIVGVLPCILIKEIQVRDGRGIGTGVFCLRHTVFEKPVRI
jgi:hypothetical protein